MSTDNPTRPGKNQPAKNQPAKNQPAKKKKRRPGSKPRMIDISAIGQPMALTRPRCLLSVVVPARNEGINLRRTVEQLVATLPDESEIIVVDNGSEDGCSRFLHTQVNQRLRLIRKPVLGSPQARNLGAERAHGDVLVFADAHVDVTPGWWEPLLNALDAPGVGAVGPAISVQGRPRNIGYGYRLSGPELGCEWLNKQRNEPYPVPCLCGCFIALRHTTFEAIGGFDNGIWVWGSEDSELSLRLWLRGYQLHVVPEVVVAHLFREKHPYSLGWVHSVHNRLRMAFAHFSPTRLARVIAVHRQYSGFDDALAKLADSDTWERRKQLASLRTHDDDWFFARFGMNV